MTYRLESRLSAAATLAFVAGMAFLLAHRPADPGTLAWTADPLDDPCLIQPERPQDIPAWRAWRQMLGCGPAEAVTLTPDPTPPPRLEDIMGRTPLLLAIFDGSRVPPGDTTETPATPTPAPAIPLPASVWLLLGALAGLGMMKWRKR